MSHHLGYAAGAEKPHEATNHRSGKSGKTVLTDDGPFAYRSAAQSGRRIRTPVDRQNTNGTSPALTTRSSPCSPGG